VGAYHLLWFVEEAGGIKDCGENASNEVVDMLDILLLSLISADIFYFQRMWVGSCVLSIVMMELLLLENKKTASFSICRRLCFLKFEAL